MWICKVNSLCAIHLIIPAAIFLWSTGYYRDEETTFQHIAVLVYEGLTIYIPNAIWQST
jgi:hypothetical protein